MKKNGVRFLFFSIFSRFSVVQSVISETTRTPIDRRIARVGADQMDVPERGLCRFNRDLIRKIPLERRDPAFSLPLISLFSELALLEALLFANISEFKSSIDNRVRCREDFPKKHPYADSASLVIPWMRVTTPT